MGRESNPVLSSVERLWQPLCQPLSSTTCTLLEDHLEVRQLKREEENTLAYLLTYLLTYLLMYLLTYFLTYLLSSLLYPEIDSNI